MSKVKNILRALILANEEVKGLLLTIILEAFTNGIAPLVSIYFIARMIDAVAVGASRAEMIAAAVRLVLAIAISSAAKIYFENRFANCKKKFYRTMESLLMKKSLSMEYAVLEDASTQNALSQIKQMVEYFGAGLIENVLCTELFLRSVFRAIVAAVMCISLFNSSVSVEVVEQSLLNSPYVGIGLAMTMLAMTVLSAKLMGKVENFLKETASYIAFFNRFGTFLYVLAYDRKAAPDCRLYRQDVSISKKYDQVMKLEFLDKFYNKCYPKSTVNGGLGALLNKILIIPIYLYIGVKGYYGAFPVGSVSQYIGAISSLSGAIYMVLFYIEKYRANDEFLKMMFGYLDIPNKMYRGTLTVEKRNDRKYQIEFKNVSFQYPGSDSYALKNVSFKIDIGQRLALVGENGSGKTTFIKLLMRLYDPSEGEILLNGIDIKKYDYDEYMKIFATVFQDYKLFDISIKDNIVGTNVCDDSRVEDFVDRLGLGDLIKRCKQGLDSVISQDNEDGVKLSGGEAQKIAIARALYIDKPFIILDEPTASLDPISEFEIYQRLDKIVEDRSAIFISHRLSSCRFSDRIAVFCDGRIVEIGTHADLLAENSGKYAELWSAQSQYYTDEEQIVLLQS